jgi:hypothetical protein
MFVAAKNHWRFASGFFHHVRRGLGAVRTKIANSHDISKFDAQHFLNVARSSTATPNDANANALKGIGGQIVNGLLVFGTAAGDSEVGFQDDSAGEFYRTGFGGLSRGRAGKGDCGSRQC